MGSTSNSQLSLRRVKKFASSSVLESNYTNAATPPTPNPTQNNLRTLVNITNHPLNHPRSRSLSQSQFEGPKFPFHNQTQRFTRKSVSQATLQVKQHATIESLISNPPASLVESLQDLRYLILTEGVTADMDGNSPLRIYIWSILLGVTPMRTGDYVSLVRRGASSSYSKIRNDTFRTLATDPLFRRRVSEASLIRLLNAFQWKMRDTGVDAQYVQGMNVIAAPFLYAARSEVEAFSLFAIFIQRECPAYVRPTMEGVHSGLKLVDQCLETVDPKLYAHLQSKFLSAELYAFPSVLTLSACTPPLPEVLKLWDFLLAYGAHLNILCVVAQLLLMRDELLAAQSPMKLLRQFPPLNSKTIISVAVSLVRKIPEDLFEALVNHAR
ncbi:CDC16 protein [Maublancomyces gigas]|uniref:CDC16 protein n=1 Tax=Discina gigas TaxID=1032678 RepID=A0ABR3GUT2_9PEZI